MKEINECEDESAENFFPYNPNKKNIYDLFIKKIKKGAPFDSNQVRETIFDKKE